jgi:hypothetical protein
MHVRRDVGHYRGFTSLLSFSDQQDAWDVLLSVNDGEGAGAGATDGETLLQPLILLTCDTRAVQMNCVAHRSPSI